MRIRGFRIDRLSGFIGALGAISGKGKLPVFVLAKAAWATAFKKPVDRARWQRRMKACMRCPIYNYHRKTCSRGDLGCDCYMPFKARLVEARCWGDENNLNIPGWKHEKSPTE